MDTDRDSWNSGDDMPDIFDNTVYDGEVSPEAENGEFVGDEGDEDNLGTPIKDGVEDIDDISTVDDDVVNLKDDLEALEDSEYNDNSFDCD
jgi:hypothetical protein